MGRLPPSAPREQEASEAAESTEAMLMTGIQHGYVIGMLYEGLQRFFTHHDIQHDTT